jgi:outer membrane protein assembly factor BamB
MKTLLRWMSGLSLVPLAGLAVDWPQYRGPTHDGVSPEVIRTNWSAQPPRQVWKVTTLNGGFSSFTVSGGRAFTLDQRNVSGTMREVCVALDANTGQELWAAPVGNADYDGGTGSVDGPRSTPSVDGDRVYVLSAYVSLFCLNPTNGAVIWSKDLMGQYGGQNIGWESAASPLIEGDLIFVNCNGSGHRLLALHKTDGSEAWKGTDYGMTHSTPVAATIQGTRQVIFYTSSGLVSVVPETGSVLWRYATPNCPYSSTATAMSPAVGDDTLFCAAAYGVGGAAVRITKSGANLVATERWPKKTNLQCHWSTPVYRNGCYYGIYGSYSSTLPLRCVDAATGNVLWSQSGFGSGGVLLVGPYLLVLSVSGNVVLVDPAPTGYREIARLPNVIAGDCWNVPSVSNGRIYARSTTEAVCLDVSAAAPAQPLRVRPVLNAAAGSLQLQVLNQDDTPIDPSRVANISIVASTNLGLTGTGWTALAGPLVLSKGVLYLEDLQGGVLPQRFYQTVEGP